MGIENRVREKLERNQEKKLVYTKEELLPRYVIVVVVVVVVVKVLVVVAVKVRVAREI